MTVPRTPGGYVEDETISGFVSNLQPGSSYIFSDGWPLSGGGDTARKFILREPSSILGGFFFIVISCIEACESEGTIAAHYIAATEVDPTPPVISKVEGSLLSGEVLRGRQSLLGEASDIGGGVSRIEALVNGLPAAPTTTGACGVALVSNASYQGRAAISPTPCPARLTGSWSLDTTSYPFQNGTNSVQVCASDLATIGSPNTTCSPPQTVTVDNSCSESPVGGGQILTATFARSDSEQVTVPFGRPAEVRGELADDAGDPISGATICIESQIEDSAPGSAPVATTKTDAQGRFSYEVPGGPNRRMLVGYRHDSFQVGRTMRLFARAKPTLHLQPGRVQAGGRVRITGKLPAPDAAGRVVVLQASALHGRRWYTFRRATTGQRGYFAATYRFIKSPESIIYRMRAVVPPQNGYPYATGHSKPARVKVRAVRTPPSARERIISEFLRSAAPTIESVHSEGSSFEMSSEQSQVDHRARRTK
ncbi:MAG TPA: hypothetical protein VGG40_00915 [Solirubrobacterales bacterium]